MTSIGITLRPAQRCDSYHLFNWVNAPDSLVNKQNTDGPIDRDSHEAWLEQRLADPDTFMFIIERNAAVSGQVRLQRREDAFEVDIYLTKDIRRSGYAKQAISSAMRILRKKEPGAMVRALVRKGNTPSRRLFESLGFIPAGQVNNFTVYEYQHQIDRNCHEP